MRWRRASPTRSEIWRHPQTTRSGKRPDMRGTAGKRAAVARGRPSAPAERDASRASRRIEERHRVAIRVGREGSRIDARQFTDHRSAYDLLDGPHHRAAARPLVWRERSRRAHNLEKRMSTKTITAARKKAIRTAWRNTRSAWRKTESSLG